MAEYILTQVQDTFPGTGQDLSGEDRIYGLCGDDHIFAGTGHDTVFGGLRKALWVWMHPFERGTQHIDPVDRLRRAMRGRRVALAKTVWPVAAGRT